MATFDQLSAEQRAIIELVLKQGQTYDQLGDMLAMPTTRVRELAREALVRLSPVSAASVDSDWRGQIADYLLNAQSGPEQTATRGHLRRSESARAWARSVLDSLEQFYADDAVPTIPEGDRGGERKPRRARRTREPAPAAAAPAAEAKEAKRPKDAEERAPKPSRTLSPEARSAVRRRRLAGAGALALVVAVAVLVWPVGVGPLALGGSDAEDSADNGEGDGGGTGTGGDAQNAATEPEIIGQLPLGPIESLKGSRDAAGIAAIASQAEERTLIVQAQLPMSEEGQAYQVWLYNADDDAVSLGAQVTDARGGFQGAGPLPNDFDKYRFVDVSREDIRGEETHSGNSVLRGALADLAPPAAAEGGAAPTAPESP